MNSFSQINNCHEIIPYISPVNIVRIANESELTIHQLTGRKRGLINAEVIALSIVSFAIVPLAGETNIYTIKLYKGEDLVDPFRLNKKYHDILDDWTCEKRRRPNGQCDKVYYHMKKRSICRSVMNVCRYIFDGYEKMKVEVDSETNMIKEIKIGSPKRPSKKRKKEPSNSEHTTKEQKANNGELYVGNEVALMCEMIELKETSEFVVCSMDNLKNLPNPKAFDKQSSSNLSNDDVLMRSLVQKEKTERITNLDCHEVVVVLHQEVDKVKMTKEYALLQTFLLEVAPPMKIGSAKEGDKTTLEDSHGKEDNLISHENIFTNMDNFDLFSPKEDDPFILYGIENDDFEDAYTPNIKDM
ncbi:hypothetical protein H5410_057386 [Solanum commersonii]|uniref:Uncharacterized protein n=1 Tax=Solanum commersonii TaxID=4109 RepID=A0A9J5WQ08_SOLCO|nr:hypothetical protein H5410_057386 [Solanum commersonii]